MKWILLVALLPTLTMAVTLSGKYQKKCTQVHPDFQVFQKKEMTFRPKKYTLINKKFEQDPQCTNATSEISLEVEYQLIGSKSNKEYNADLRIQKYLITSLTPEDALEKNMEKFCGIKWIPNKRVDATDLECGKGYKNKKIFHKLHISKDSIFLGLMTQDADGSSPEKRPKTIDLSNPYVKAKD